jgi:hypothetical protein
MLSLKLDNWNKWFRCVMLKLVIEVNWRHSTLTQLEKLLAPELIWKHSMQSYHEKTMRGLRQVQSHEVKALERTKQQNKSCSILISYCQENGGRMEKAWFLWFGRASEGIESIIPEFAIYLSFASLIGWSFGKDFRQEARKSSLLLDEIKSVLIIENHP